MWIDILDKYQVSDSGQVRNKYTGYTITQFVGKDGYVRLQIGGKTRTVHRLVALAFLPVEPGKDFVNHKDGNKQNNRVENLEWCTRSENMSHAYTLGLKHAPSGTNNGHCKLSYDDVCFILENYKPGDKQYGAQAMANLFGVARQTISAVVTGQTWKCARS